jgi:hypothetical protein
VGEVFYVFGGWIFLSRHRKPCRNFLRYWVVREDGCFHALDREAQLCYSVISVMDDGPGQNINFAHARGVNQPGGVTEPLTLAVIRNVRSEKQIEAERLHVH